MKENLNIVRSINFDNYELLLVELNEDFVLEEPTLVIHKTLNINFKLSENVGKYLARSTEFNTLKTSRDIYKSSQSVWSSVITTFLKLKGRTEEVTLENILLANLRTGTKLYGIVGKDLEDESLNYVYDTFTDLELAEEVLLSMEEFPNLRITKYGKYRVVVGSRNVKVSKSICTITYLYYLESKYVNSYAILWKNTDSVKVVYDLYSDYLDTRRQRFSISRVGLDEILRLESDSDTPKPKSKLLEKQLSLSEVSNYLKLISNTKFAPTTNFLESNSEGYTKLQSIYNTLDYSLDSGAQLNTHSPLEILSITRVTVNDLVALTGTLILEDLSKYTKSLGSTVGVSKEFSLDLSTLLSRISCYLRLISNCRFDSEIGISLGLR